MTGRLPKIGRGVLAAMLGLMALAVAGLVVADRAAAGKKTQDRVAAAVRNGTPIHWRQVVRVWIPRAAGIGGGVLLVAAALLPWAGRALNGGNRKSNSMATEDPDAPEDPAERTRRRLGWLGVAVIAGLAGWTTAPRLNHSVWGDEERTLREFLVGQYRPGPDGTLTFDAATWGDAFFHYRTPNNHVLYSAAAQASHRWLGKPGTGAGDAYFSEWAIRFPAWLAGMAAVAGVAGLGAVVGWRRAGWVAAALLALHPGFVRYAAEARGYAFLLAAAPILIIALVRAVERGGWKWWCLAGAMDFVLLFTWPLSVHFVVAANASALLALVIHRRWSGRERFTLGLRWAVTALVASACWIVLFTPNVVQMIDWLHGPAARGAPGGPVWSDALSSLLTGRVWREADAANPWLTPWQRTWSTQPASVVLAAVFVVGALGAGLVAAWRRTPALRPWLPAFTLPPLLTLAQATATHSVLYHWYLVVSVPGALLLIAIGFEAAATRLTRTPAGQAAVLGAGVLGYSILNGETRHHLRRHPIEQNREAALLVQPVINPHHPDYQRHVLTAGFLGRMTIYDPGVREFESAEELNALMAEARSSGRDLVVSYGQRELARQIFPEIMRLLDDPSVFEPLATLYGQEEFTTRFVVRHRPPR